MSGGGRPLSYEPAQLQLLRPHRGTRLPGRPRTRQTPSRVRDAPLPVSTEPSPRRWSHVTSVRTRRDGSVRLARRRPRVLRAVLQPLQPRAPSQRARGAGPMRERARPLGQLSGAATTEAGDGNGKEQSWCSEPEVIFTEDLDGSEAEETVTFGSTASTRDRPQRPERGSTARDDRGRTRLP